MKISKEIKTEVNQFKENSKVFAKGILFVLYALYTAILFALGVIAVYSIPSYNGFKAVAIFLAGVIFIRYAVKEAMSIGKNFIYKKKSETTSINFDKTNNR